MVLVLLFHALCALIYPLCKLVFPEHIQPIFFTGMRMLLGGTVLLIYQYWQNKQAFVWKHKYLIPLLAFLIGKVFVANLCECWGLQHMSVAKTYFIFNLTPFFSVLFSYWFLSEKMSRLKWVGLIIGLFGFIPFFLAKKGSELSIGGIPFSWVEIALVVGAIASVLGAIGLRKLMLDGYSIVVANGISMFLSTLLFIPTSLYFELWNPVPVHHWGYALIFLVIIVVISNIIMYNFQGWLLGKYTTTFVMFAGFIGPLFAAIFGWFLLGEKIGWMFIIATIIVFFGLYLFYLQEHREIKKAKKATKLNKTT